MWNLVIETEGERTVVPLRRDAYEIGRGQGNTVRLTERNISRRHARLRRGERGYAVEDLGSSNGTWVNSRRIAGETLLQLGDIVQIGDYCLALELDAMQLPVPQAMPPGTPVTGPGGSLFAMRPPRLVVVAGPAMGLEIPLVRPRTVIGRGEDVDVPIDHSSVSRRHCEIVALPDGRFEVFDAGSANGLLWNGQQLPQAMLEAGDVVTLGELSLRFVPAGQALRTTQRDMAPVPVRRSSVWATLIPLSVFVVVVGVGAFFAWRFAHMH
jgi:pSer/pThr/pTyr-binding forkhead associated (FHA) protein